LINISPVAAPKKHRAVRPRHAASLIIVRQSHTGPEMLMGMRGAKHRFMPNRLVFPGGAVDPTDHKTPFSTPLRDETKILLERTAPPRLAQALAAAAARELEEETGLTLGAPPALDGLSYLCRAVTPPSQPVRFNARFLVVDVDRISGTLAGSGELEELRYYAMAEALAFDLAGITRDILKNLQRFLQMSPQERLDRIATPLNRFNNWRTE